MYIVCPSVTWVNLLSQQNKYITLMASISIPRNSRPTSSGTSVDLLSLAFCVCELRYTVGVHVHNVGVRVQHTCTCTCTCTAYMYITVLYCCHVWILNDERGINSHFLCMHGVSRWSCRMPTSLERVNIRSWISFVTSEVSLTTTPTLIIVSMVLMPISSCWDWQHTSLTSPYSGRSLNLDNPSLARSVDS